MTPPQTDPPPLSDFTFERRVALLTGVIVILFVLYLVDRNEAFASSNLAILMRIVLSVAVGIVGATIPGFLNIEYTAGGFVIRAAGALALSVMTYFGTPHVEELGLHAADAERSKNEARIISHLSNSRFCSDARDESSKLTKKWPDYPQGYNLLGASHYCLGNYDSAEKYFNQAHELDKNELKYQFNWGASLIKLRKIKEAKEVYNRLNQEYENNGKIDEPTVFNFALVSLLVDDHKTAKNQFTKILNDANYKLDAQFGIEICKLAAGDNVTNVAKKLNKIVSVDPYYKLVIVGETPPGSRGKMLEPFVWVVLKLDPAKKKQLASIGG
jgi:tetratricopeptide (TPR) repeat protein